MLLRNVLLTMGYPHCCSMIDGKEYIGAKAYKDSKVCNMLTMRQLHQRYHESTGVTFSSLYPGCIAETPLFRNHNFLFRIVFPFMMKNVTKAFVTAEEAGWRLAQICTNPVYGKSGVYWGWKQGGDSYFDNFNSDDRTNAYENEPSEEVQDDKKGSLLFELTEQAIDNIVNKATVSA